MLLSIANVALSIPFLVLGGKEGKLHEATVIQQNLLSCNSDLAYLAFDH